MVPPLQRSGRARGFASGAGAGNSVTCTVSGGFGSVLLTLLDGNDQTTFADVTDVVINQHGGDGGDARRP